MAEANNNTVDGVISFKYGLMVAFARKRWKLQPSVRRCVQLGPISEARLTTLHPTTHAHTARKIVHSFRVWKKAAYMHTPNNVMYHTLISICVCSGFQLLSTYKQ
jgi:hypothetical protein